MLSSEEILATASQDGSIDIAEWPRVLETMLRRLHDIVYNDFPTPTAPLPPSSPPTIDPEVVASTPPALPTSDGDAPGHDLPEAENGNEDHSDASQGSTKENDAPVTMAASAPPPLTAYSPGLEISESQQTEEIPPGLSDGYEPEGQRLPPDLLRSYQSTEHTLRFEFGQSPPYTIQRLAELILYPKKHYRFLPSYLRALDRIVAVSSPVSDFPLPALHASTNGGFLTNGDAQVNGISEREGLGSDESLGGALLTPIPWLRNQSSVLTQTSSTSEPGADGKLHHESTETIDGPHGAGRIETVSVTVNGISSVQPSQSVAPTEAEMREQGAVTQGELLRKEQEAGIVPVDNHGRPVTSSRGLFPASAAAVGRDAHPPLSDPMLDDWPDEGPVARGPDVIGMEDMGPQQHPVGANSGALDMEAAVGRGRSKSPQPPPVEESASEQMEDVRGPEKQEGSSGDGEVEKSVEKLKEVMEQESKDADGDSKIGDVGPAAANGNGS